MRKRLKIEKEDWGAFQDFLDYMDEHLPDDVKDEWTDTDAVLKCALYALFAGKISEIADFKLKLEVANDLLLRIDDFIRCVHLDISKLISTVSAFK
jgi:hypothetical protein